MRRAAKRDQSEAAIVDYLRAAGWSVLQISAANCPDLLLGAHGQNILAEVKTGKKKLRPGQVLWHADWRGDRPYILRSVEDAEALTLVIRKLAKI